MHELLSWVRTWGFCDWIGFWIIAGLGINAVRGLFAPYSRKETTRIYCPKCGYDGAKKIQKTKVE